MYAGVGPSRTLRHYFFARNSSNGRGQRALNGRSLGLNLPSGKISSVIRQCQLEISHAEKRIFRNEAASKITTDVHVAREGVGSHPTRSAILGEFFFTVRSASFGCRTLPRDVANS